MAQLTLLDMAQSIASSLNSDEFNSISDTTESMQIARIIRNKYYDILARGNIPEQQTLIQLTASGDNTKPTLMYVPAGVIRLDWIKYFDATVNNGAAAGYKYVIGLPMDQFIDQINTLNPSESTVGTFLFTEGGADFTFYYNNNSQPKYYTVIENGYVIFDSYNSALDTTLQTSKTMSFGLKVSPFTLTDTFVPDLDDDKFPLLLNEAKALAFYELKQQPHTKADQEIKRQWGSIQKDKAISNKPSYFDQLPSFGRVPRTGGYGVSPIYRWMRAR